jgi:hypothetical protein
MRTALAALVAGAVLLGIGVAQADDDVEAAFAEATRLADDGDRVAAQAAFEAVAAMDPTGPRAAAALEAAARLAEERGDVAAAARLRAQAAGGPGADPPAVDDGWARYDRAFVLLASGQRDEARSLLAALRAELPGHPAAARAGVQLGQLDRPVEPAVEPAAPGASQEARAELILWMTVSGVLLGRDACVDQCESSRGWVLSLTAGGAGALGLTVAATRRGVRSGQAQLYNSSVSWGSWNALGLNDGFADDAGEARVAILAQAAGLGVGLGLWKVWRPTAGDVALTNTVAAWATVLTLFGHLWADVEPTLREIVAVGDLGLLAGALLSTQVKMSRGRTFLIDVGGILGTLGGGFLGAMSSDENVAGAAMLVSAAAGLGIATLATRRWDDDDDGPPVRVAPTRLDAGGWGGAVAIEF